MPEDVLHKSIDLMLENPASVLTMELQGGEPLLNFPLVREAVLYTKQRNQKRQKQIEFVICTNLTLLEDEHLDFFREHHVQVSSSLDGPEFVHDRHRLWNRHGSHTVVTRNIKRVQEALGCDAVSCLMTTTRTSLKYPREIIDEYLRLDLRSIFIRDLNPYGYALKTRSAIGYTTEEFLRFYKEILDYLAGEISLEEAVYRIKRDTRHFAKRQITWFKRERDVIWLSKEEFHYQDDQLLQYIKEQLQKQGILTAKK